MATTTAALVEAASKGDEQAWAELVERYSRLVWSVARSYGLSEIDAADVSQTAWLRLIEHLDRLRQPEYVASWLVTATRRECLRTLRRAGREVPTEDIDSDDEPWPPPGSRPVTETHAVLWAAFARLPERCRKLLRVWATAADASYAEIATALGIPVGSIGPTRARCLEQLRRLLGGRSTPDSA
ncbi:MAG: sigma-70 family RNA polymerase sigma factor [Sporichthyaceae bacterium]|nr:sigma-70 family RNA polymerase sigma factor [Sporichthyaceae bacterium]